MPSRLRATLLAVFGAALLAAATGPPAAAADTSSAVAVATAPAPPSTVAGANDFVPDRDLDECISALPKPDCGSEARGGWRQWLVFAVVLVALAFIAWRIVRSARRHRDRDPVGTKP